MSTFRVHITFRSGAVVVTQVEGWSAQAVRADVMEDRTVSYVKVTPLARTPRLYVVRDEMAVEGKAVYSAPVVTPAAPALASLSTDALIRLLVA